jgi:hypothetical protein
MRMTAVVTMPVLVNADDDCDLWSAPRARFVFGAEGQCAHDDESEKNISVPLHAI